LASASWPRFVLLAEILPDAKQPVKCISVARLRAMVQHIGGDGLDPFEFGNANFEHQAAVANATAAGGTCGGLPRHKPDADRRRTGGQRGEGVWHFRTASWGAGCRRTDSQIGRQVGLLYPSLVKTQLGMEARTNVKNGSGESHFCKRWSQSLCPTQAVE
jgi:hypothetical protein